MISEVMNMIESTASNVIEFTSTGTAGNVTITDPYWWSPPSTYSYYSYPQRDGIRDWLEGFLDGKSHLTKSDTDRLKSKLGLEI